MAGVDISKFALRRAAKRLKQGEFAVASVYHLPVETTAPICCFNVFSPLAAEEFARVLRPGGALPLCGSFRPASVGDEAGPLRQALRKPVKAGGLPRLPGWEAVPLRYPVHLECAQDIMALFDMTPYAWKTPKAGVERLSAREELDTQIGFDIHVYRKL